MTRPVLFAASITKAVQATLACLVLLGVLTLTVDQLAGIVIAVEAVIGVPLTFWAQAQVTPTSP